MYETDIPIKIKEDDELNRFKFVEILYDSIIDYGKNENECLVIGLMGEWGCGKTSIINMLYKEIENFNKKQNPEKQWICIKFNPWYFSNQNSILYHFFDFLIKEFNKTNKIKTYLSEFKDKLAKFSFSASYMGAGFGISYDNPDVDSNIYKSFNSMKKDLMDLFYGLEYAIIISIDDIDRLSDQEMQQIFLLVKALADFPNVIYILSFDKNVAIKALTNLQVYSPEKFLEKIINIPILVPEITKTRLDLIIENKLKPIYDTNNKLPYNNFEEIFTLIRPFFTNIRDLKRYINVLTFYLNQFKDEVNIGDFLLIIAIQLFEYEFYNQIRNNKDILTNYEKIITMKKESIIEIYDSFLKKFTNPSKYDSNDINELMEYLFPAIKEYEYLKPEYVERYFNAELRICSEIHFDKYFTLAVEEDEISQIDIENMLNLEETSEISKTIKEFSKLGKSQSLLFKLKNNVYRMDNEKCEKIILALFDIGDNIKYTPKVYATLDSLCQYLGYTSYPILLNSVNSCESFYTFCYFIHETGYKYGLYHGDKRRPDGFHYLGPDEFKDIKNLAYQRIRTWANNGKLLNNDFCIYYLDFWLKWSTKDEVMSFIETNTNTDEKLLNFLDKFKIHTEEPLYYAEVNNDFTFDWHRLYQYFGYEELEKRIKKIALKGNLSEDQKNLCELFLTRNNEGVA